MEKWKKWKKKDSLSNKLCLTLKTSMDKTKKQTKPLPTKTNGQLNRSFTKED